MVISLQSVFGSYWILRHGGIVTSFYWGQIQAQRAFSALLRLFFNAFWGKDFSVSLKNACKSLLANIANSSTNIPQK